MAFFDHLPRLCAFQSGRKLATTTGTPATRKDRGNRNNTSAFQPRAFTSYERDGNAADEAMFRRYNRWWSRFDQADPYDGSYDMANPQSFNRYAYVQNDPVNQPGLPPYRYGSTRRPK